MRTNLEHARVSAARNFAPRFSAATIILQAPYTIPPLGFEGPVVYNFDTNNATRIVTLPPLAEERFIVIANIGTFALTVQDSQGLVLITVFDDMVGLFFGGSTKWRWILGSQKQSSGDPSGMSEQMRVVTAAGAQSVSSTEPGIIVAKSVASITPVQLPTVLSRAGKPVRLVDWIGNSDIQITPAAGEKIMNLTSWTITASGSGGTILFPNVALAGWTIGA